MANTATAPTESAKPTLELLSSGGALLDSVPVISAGAHAYTRNRQPYQAYAVDTQGSSGDGRRVVGQRTIDLLIQDAADAPANQRLYELSETLENTSKLRLGAVTITLAAVAGFTATQPLTGDRDGDLRVTLAYIPTTQAATTDSGVMVLGPL